MNKKTMRIAGWALGLSLAVAGIGAAIGGAKTSAEVSASAASPTYLHVMTAKPAIGDNTLSHVVWTVSATNLNNYNSANYAGVQFGSSKGTGSITLTSKSAWGADPNLVNGTDTAYNKGKIKKVYVWLNKGDGTVTPSVTIGGKAATSDGTVVAKNSSAGSDYTKTTCVTFTPGDADTGILSISVSSTKAGYFCAIGVDCEE